MQSIDAILHVNPTLDEVGLAMVFNPTSSTVKQNLRLPLYYTGLTDTAKLTDSQGNVLELPLSRGYDVDVPIEMAPKSIEWFVVERA